MRPRNDGGAVPYNNLQIHFVGLGLATAVFVQVVGAICVRLRTAEDVGPYNKIIKFSVGAHHDAPDSLPLKGKAKKDEADEVSRAIRESPLRSYNEGKS